MSTDHGGWQLEILTRRPGRALEPEVSIHRTAMGAKARAALHESERIRRLGLQTNLAVMIGIVTIWLFNGASMGTSIADFVLWMLLFSVLMRSFERALSAAFKVDKPEKEQGHWAPVARWSCMESLLPPLRLPLPPQQSVGRLQLGEFSQDRALLSRTRTVRDPLETGKVRILDPFD